MRKGVRKYQTSNLTRVRHLRKEGSISEAVVWDLIRNQKLGFKFKRQFPVGPYVLDFYCAEAHLALEIDGEQHGAMVVRDSIRDEWIRGQGIETLRIPSLDFFEYTGSVGYRWLMKVKEACEVCSGRPAFPEQL
jgi:very-short-patch-repair endonuclease